MAGCRCRRKKCDADEPRKENMEGKRNKKLEDQHKTADSSDCYGRGQSGAVLVPVGASGRRCVAAGKFGPGKMV